MTEQEQPKNDFMHKLALQIVERRNLAVSYTHLTLPTTSRV